MLRILGVKALCLALCCYGFIAGQVSSLSVSNTASKAGKADNVGFPQSRRSFGQQIASLPFVVAGGLVVPAGPAIAKESLTELKATVQQARSQMDPISGIIQKQEWETKCAILVTPPLSDFWTKSKRKENILAEIADAVGDAGGDELAILEQREEVQSHLRYLDMAVYNNVFNPITTVGETGATKALIESYYEDPKRELKASVAALDRILAAMQSS